MDSESGLRMMAEIFGKREEGIKVLHERWREWRVPASDLPDLIPGFFSVPNALIAPTTPLPIYRGASQPRSRGMAWSSTAPRPSS